MNRDHLIYLLYALEEIFGFRVSLHFLRRYLETSNEQYLEKLALAVCREKVLDYDDWSSLVLPDGTLNTAEGLDHTIGCIRDVAGDTLLDVIDDPLLFSRMSRDYFGKSARIVDHLVYAISNHTTANWKDALSRNQIKSKLWLLDRLVQIGWLDIGSKVTLVGGWIGILPMLIGLRREYVDEIVSYDLDPDVHDIAAILNRDSTFKFKSVCQDIRTVPVDASDIVINSIAEHITDNQDWIKSLPQGTRVIMQGNDMFEVSDHVNCHKDLKSFVEASGLSEILWKGELFLPGCTRFMVIGKV